MTRRVTLAAGAVGVALLAGCSVVDEVGATGTTTPAPPPPAPEATLQFSVTDMSAPIRPDADLSVAATGGEMVTVRLIGPDNEVVPGRIVDGRWQLDEATRLVPDSTYTWRASARNPDGVVTTTSHELRTLTPEIEATYRVTPDGHTVGVGMPVMVTFDSAVMTSEMRADVERRMTIKTTPEQSGSWGWLDDRQLMWRPDEYWKPGTKISVNAPLTGVQTGENKWIGEHKGGDFTIADRARVSTVDIGNHVMTVRENGSVVATYPVSSGKATPEWETRSGTKVITEMHAEYTMDAGTLGVDEDDDDYYLTDVEYAMRVTNTGEFLHAAPWSTWAQGRRNVSHGCVNMSTAAAREMFNRTLIGDVVEFVNSGRQMKAGDGLSVWIFTPQEWAERSAL